MTKEALTLALEALEYVNRTGDTQTFDMCYAEPAITAIKEALAQTEHEFVRGECVKCGASIERTEQEPVAWARFDIEGKPNKFRLNEFSDSVPLYAAPQPCTDDLALIAYMDGICEGQKRAANGIKE